MTSELSSIDLRLQYMAYRELAAGIRKNDADGGSLVMLDARTGEVLAMANLPSYNPNNRTSIDVKGLRNQAITDAIEPGSVMKPPRWSCCALVTTMSTRCAVDDIGRLPPVTGSSSYSAVSAVMDRLLWMTGLGGAGSEANAEYGPALYCGGAAIRSPNPIQCRPPCR